MKLWTLTLIIGIALLVLMVSGCNTQDTAPFESVPSATPDGTEETSPAAQAPTEEPTAAPTEDQAATDEKSTGDSASVSEPASDPQPESAKNSAEGIIAFKSDSLHGEMTASGVPYNKDAMVAAHKDLPFGTVVTVINLFNGKSVVVEIVDRLPPNVTALIDVSSAAARELDMIESGMVDGRIEW